MLGERGKRDEAEVLGSVAMKSVCRVRGVGVERRLRFLRQYQKQHARAAKQTPMGMPTSMPMWECLVGGKIEGDPVKLLVAELKIALWLPSGVTV